MQLANAAPVLSKLSQPPVMTGLRTCYFILSSFCVLTGVQLCALTVNNVIDMVDYAATVTQLLSFDLTFLLI